MDEAEVKNKFDFLDCLQGTELFAKLDFALKDGVHIQERGKQKELFLYIQSFPSSLKHYYFDFFGLGL